MKIQQSTVTKLLLTELDRLDPVTVFLEDYGDNKGKLIIECYGKSWSAYWGSMGGNLAKFIKRVSSDYIANSMDGNLQCDQEDYDAFEKKARQCVLTDRRKREISNKKARAIWEEIDLSFPEDGASARYYRGNLLVDLFGDEWWYTVPTKPNPEYVYLTRIIDAVKEGVAQYAKGGAA